MDDDLLPLEDACAYHGCALPKAAHVAWIDGGPRHTFAEQGRKPRPERITGCHIQTDWTCTHCGADCDVWGAAEGWMECADCGRDSYLIPGLTDTAGT